MPIPEITAKLFVDLKALLVAEERDLKNLVERVRALSAADIAENKNNRISEINRTARAFADDCHAAAATIVGFEMQVYEAINNLRNVQFTLRDALSRHPKPAPNVHQKELIAHLAALLHDQRTDLLLSGLPAHHQKDATQRLTEALSHSNHPHAAYIRPAITAFGDAYDKAFDSLPDIDTEMKALTTALEAEARSTH